LPFSLFAPLQVLLALAAGAACGAVWAGIAAVLKVWRGVDEIIVTLMLSFIAIFFVQYLVQGPLQPPDAVANTSRRIDENAQLPVLIPGTRLHIGFAIAIAAAALTWYMLYRTSLGLRMRATGLNPRAARAQGLPVRRLLIVSMLISGALGGLAGVGEVLGVQFRLLEGFSENIGFEGLAIAFLGGLEPVAITIVALYFGMVRNGAIQLELDQGVPAAVSLMMEALPIIFLAAARGWLVLRGRLAA
jgi:simple sugar transport system permease protein